MDGFFNGKPYCLMDDLGVPYIIFGNTHIVLETPNNQFFLWMLHVACYWMFFLGWYMSSPENSRQGYL